MLIIKIQRPKKEKCRICKKGYVIDKKTQDGRVKRVCDTCEYLYGWVK
jgi:hypothetical protein